ncbi:MAG: hypothetical protein COA63_010780 [Methylophaga sp.]|nr:hypothetical protein [Methylophaga sp.]
MEKDEQSFTSVQPDLFQQLADHEPEYLAANAPDLDIEQEFMGAIKYALRTAKKRGLSRERIVDRMNLCLPEELYITKRQLDAWCAESKEYHHFPAIYLSAFIWATGGIISPLEILSRALGLHLLDEHEQLAAQLGQSMLTKVQASNTEKRIKKQFGFN